MSATAPLRTILLNAKTTGTSLAVDCARHPLLTLFVKVAGTLGAGTLILEEADYEPGVDEVYTGTWSLINTFTLTDIADATQVAFHIGGPGGLFAFKMVRVRIGTTVTDGTVTAVLCGTGIG